jgi:mono/diheme cytochrome c family protein
MLRRGIGTLLTFLACLHPAANAGDGPALSTDAQAVLDRHCVKCHGPLEQKSGLRLDSAASLWKGNDDGAVAVAGKPDESKLVRVLAADADPHMPPKKQLTAEDVAKVRAWVTNAGKPAAATVAKAAIPEDPTAAIDQFLVAGWQSRQLKPAPLCDDRTFVRRVTLDLIGRIPTPEETQSFLFEGEPALGRGRPHHDCGSPRAARRQGRDLVSL